MSGYDAEDYMEWTSESSPLAHSPEETPSSQNKDPLYVTLSLEWSAGGLSKAELQKAFQTWGNKNKPDRLNCSVLRHLEDGRVLVEIDPAPDMSVLKSLTGQTLHTKNNKTVNVTSFCLTQPETQVLEAAPVYDPPLPRSELQQENMQPNEQGNLDVSTEAPTAQNEACLLSPSHFWYLNHIYKDEIKRILEENGVEMETELRVVFKAGQKDGSPAKAVSEFTNLTQKSLGESDSSAIPLKQLDAEKLKDTLNFIRSQDKKLLLALSSQEMTICGPSQSRNAISKSLSTTQKTSATTTYNFSSGSTWSSSQKSEDIVLNINDPLARKGLIIEESHWKLITASFWDSITEIETKFGVQCERSMVSPDKVAIKAVYKGIEGNASMESHATRALVRLYQKIVASQTYFHQQPETVVPHDSSDNVSFFPEGASGGPVSNGHWEPSVPKAEAATEEGAAAGDSKDEICTICLDSFTDKIQLKCTHEFCEACLDRAIQNQGPICPICKNVFGAIEGNQPEGTMEARQESYSLPGFKNCGTIEISYYIPDGIQTKKHPNPGQQYHGTKRRAYLPNNKEGKEVLRLLEKAFKQKLIFTVGTSTTTGFENQVTWNDIHHKTSISGGPENFGYPDRTYLSRVKEELKSKGIV